MNCGWENDDVRNLDDTANEVGRPSVFDRLGTLPNSSSQHNIAAHSSNNIPANNKSSKKDFRQGKKYKGHYKK